MTERTSHITEAMVMFLLIALFAVALAAYAPASSGPDTPRRLGPPASVDVLGHQ